MFIALDKIHHQGLKKVVVAVPEKSIGRSFKNTELKRNGFFADWKVAPYFNLCDTENESDKARRFVEFFAQDSKPREASREGKENPHPRRHRRWRYSYS